MAKTKQRVGHAGQDPSQQRIASVLEQDERRGKEAIFEEIIAKHFLNLMKKTATHRFRKINPNKMNNFLKNQT